MAMKEVIYLDYNATAPMRGCAFQAMMDVACAPHNASSVHAPGRAARRIIEEARVKVAALIGAQPSQIIFNSGATEGNNTVLKFFAGERVLVSAIEHPSVYEPLPTSEKISMTADGIVDLAALEKMLREERAALVSVMYANNETGAIQPVKEIAEIAHKHGAFYHCDAVQAAGKIAIDMAADGIDFLSFSAHKIGGPQGVGALALGLCGVTPVLLEGGGQEKKARAGTENVAGIAGFGAAAAEALQQLENFQKLCSLRETLEKSLQKISPEIVIHAKGAPRLANTSFFSLPGAPSETLLMNFDLEGIAVSNGSACSSGTVRPSRVLRAMGCDDALTTSALRVSIGWDTSESDIRRFTEGWAKIASFMRRSEKISS